MHHRTHSPSDIVELFAVSVERALAVFTGEPNVGVEVESGVQSTGHPIEQDDWNPERNERGVFGIGLRGFENL
jgi:hypothetical protein